MAVDNKGNCRSGHANTTTKLRSSTLISDLRNVPFWDARLPGLPKAIVEGIGATRLVRKRPKKSLTKDRDAPIKTLDAQKARQAKTWRERRSKRPEKGETTMPPIGSAKRYLYMPEKRVRGDDQDAHIVTKAK